MTRFMRTQGPRETGCSASTLPVGCSPPPPPTSIPAVPTGPLSDLAQFGIVKSLDRAFLVIDRPRRFVHTRGAKDSGPLAIRYYGYLIVGLYHKSRLHV